MGLNGIEICQIIFEIYHSKINPFLYAEQIEYPGKNKFKLN